VREIFSKVEDVFTKIFEHERMHLQNFKKWEGAELNSSILRSSFSVEEQILDGKKRKFSKQRGRGDEQRLNATSLSLFRTVERNLLIFINAVIRTALIISNVEKKQSPQKCAFLSSSL